MFSKGETSFLRGLLMMLFFIVGAAAGSIGIYGVNCVLFGINIGLFVGIFILIIFYKNKDTRDMKEFYEELPMEDIIPILKPKNCRNCETKQENQTLQE